VDLGARVPRRGHRRDPGRLPAGLPAGRGQPEDGRPGQEEVARSLGAGRVRTFVRITLGLAKVAILGGCLLVTLVLLAEYGAFEILGYQTFTTEIFTEFNGYSFAASCALSLVLVVLSLLVLRLMAGFERADAGTIGIGGVLVDGPGVHLPPERPRIGYVPQEGSYRYHGHDAVLDVQTRPETGAPPIVVR
jgi:hypothetical protein